jgi:hypothetical protein
MSISSFVKGYLSSIGGGYIYGAPPYTFGLSSKVNHFIFLFLLGLMGLLEWPITTQKVSKKLDTPNIEFFFFFPLVPN